MKEVKDVLKRKRLRSKAKERQAPRPPHHATVMIAAGARRGEARRDETRRDETKRDETRRERERAKSKRAELSQAERAARKVPSLVDSFDLLLFLVVTMADDEVLFDDVYELCEIIGK
ncbi:hypothetical protein ALC53_01311 [Atta colombica]|uniref:Uncharacterized protein n=1 Tax=Atta colombica TaxID=520822 RepID=A0A195BWA3_9HYME|nr:hypothetical protein ALC53_01311 [Atta colombica]